MAPTPSPSIEYMRAIPYKISTVQVTVTLPAGVRELIIARTVSWRFRRDHDGPITDYHRLARRKRAPG